MSVLVIATMFATKVNVLRVAVVIAVAEASTASLRVPSADSRGVHAGCSSDLDCSLNGKCAANKCICDKPWTGASLTKVASDAF